MSKKLSMVTITKIVFDKYDKFEFIFTNIAIHTEIFIYLKRDLMYASIHSHKL